MEITLPPDLERFVTEQVTAGIYRSVSEAVSTAVGALKAQEGLPSGKELDRLIAEGQVAADRGELIPGEQVFQELREHSARSRACRS